MKFDYPHIFDQGSLHANPRPHAAVSIFATTALVLAMPPISFGQVGTPPISDGVLWGNFAVMLIGEVGAS